MARLRATLSLEGRALQLLAQRDQSRVELRRKLRRHATRDHADPASAASAAPACASAAEHGVVSDGPDTREARDAQHTNVETVLDRLEARGFLCAERFVESRIHAREARFGSLRIKAELAQHGLVLSPEAARSLAETELQRAEAVRERRFAEPPRDAAERGKQSRFLAGRGFSPHVIHRLMSRLSRAAVSSS